MGSSIGYHYGIPRQLLGSRLPSLTERVLFSSGWRKAMVFIKNGKSVQRGSYWDGHPANIPGSFARMSRPKTSVRAVKILAKKNKHFGADIHDPKARTSTTLRSGFSKPRFWGTYDYVLHPGFPVVFVISVVSAISANPAVNPLVCGCLTCLRRFSDSRRFRQKHRFSKT